MTKHFIENIRIRNFKCFDDLQVKGFARVNLFGGKNNVGKTALLEGIELLVASPESYHLVFKYVEIIERRYKGTESRIDMDILLNLFKKRQSAILIGFDSRKLMITLGFSREEKNSYQNSLFSNNDFHIDENNFNGIFFKISDHEKESETSFSIERILSRSMPLFLKDRIAVNKVPNTYIKSSKLDENEIAVLYGGLVEADKENYLNESLNNFDNSLLSFKAIPTDRKARAKLKVAGRDSLVSLSEMGDGISRYIAILCAIWSAQNGFLFIDEIENGIHYTNYPKLWNLIFDASEQANCQVFATSHSKECIEAFNQVQQAREAFKDAGCYFELFKSMKTGRITAAARGSEQLQYALEHGEEIRGE